MKVNHVRIIVFLLFQFSFVVVQATHFIPAYSGNGYKHMNFVVLSAQLGDSNYSVGDEIAVFDGTICCGVGVLTSEIEYGNNESYLVFMVSANNGFSGGDGFTEGHSIEIRCWSQISRREAVASLIFFDSNTGLELSSPPVFKSNSTVFVQLSVPNQAPVANAGEAQTVEPDSLVMLNGSASFDSDGDTLFYQWTAPDGIVLSETNAVQPTFVAPEVSETTEYTFLLVVSDGIIESEPSEVIIQVNPVVAENQVPVANAGENQIVKSDRLVTLDGSASYDPDGDVLIYSWTAPDGIVLSETNVAQPTFIAPEVSETTEYTFSLVVSDGYLESESSSVIIQVNPVVVENQVPVANAGENQIVKSDSLVTLDGSASYDPDGDILIYSWTAPDGIVLSEMNAVQPTFIAPEVSETTEYTFSLVVSDGIIESEPSEVIILVNPVVVENQAPVANAGENQIVKSDSLVTLNGSASYDPDGDILIYAWTAPDGIVLSETNATQPTFIAPEVSETTEYTFSLVVSDGILESEPSSVIIQVNPDAAENQAPVANAGENQIVKSDSLVTLDGSASYDPDGDVLIYSWTAPDGIVLSETNVAQPTFIAPEVSETTEYTFLLVVSDGIIESEPSEVIIQVNPVVAENQVPVANAGENQIVKSDSLVTLNGSASYDPDGDILIYAWTAPDGIVLSETNVAQPTFVAPEVSETTEYTFSLVVSDGYLESEPSSVIIQVNPVVAENQAPVANAGENQIVKSDSLVTLDGSASYDPDGDVLIYAWTAPDGIVLSETNAAQPTFIAPEVSETTEYTFLLVVSDGDLESEPSSVIIQVNGILSSTGIVKDKNAIVIVYPNPFSEQVYFNCAEFEGKTVVVSIYNNLGASVFCSSWDFLSGNSIFVWDGTNNNKKAVPPGFYHCIISDSTGKTGKVKIIKNR